MIDLKAYLQSQADTAAQAVEQYDADIAAKYELGKTEGIEIGRGQIQLPDDSNPDAQYTQEQMNAAINDAVANAVAPVQSQVDQLKSDLSASEEAVSKIQGEIAPITKERDAYKAAIDAEIADAKTDTSRLEAAVAPIAEEAAPVEGEA